jgi:hypothetical protein
MEHLDDVCLALRWVNYDTKGQYMGYSSSEPSFPDNFMKFDERQHRNFLELPLQAQEQQMLDVHLKAGEGCESEFFHRGTLGRLDSFDSRGCATGVVPTVAFSKVRRHLLELLAQCPPGVWFSTVWQRRPGNAPAPWRADAGGHRQTGVDVVTFSLAFFRAKRARA